MKFVSLLIVVSVYTIINSIPIINMSGQKVKIAREYEDDTIWNTRDQYEIPNMRKIDIPNQILNSYDRLHSISKIYIVDRSHYTRWNYIRIKPADLKNDKAIVIESKEEKYDYDNKLKINLNLRLVNISELLKVNISEILKLDEISKDQNNNLTPEINKIIGQYVLFDFDPKQ